MTSGAPPRRGGVYFVNFDPVRGSEQAGTRPALIISNDVANRHSSVVTVVAITHHMDEAVNADRVVVMENGRIALEGTPREVFAQVERLHELQMDVPQVAQLAANTDLPCAARAASMGNGYFGAGLFFR